MGESISTIQRSPRISTSYKFAAPRYRLPPMALQTVQVSVEPRLSIGRFCKPNRSVVPFSRLRSLRQISATTFATALSLYIPNEVEPNFLFCKASNFLFRPRRLTINSKKLSYGPCMAYSLHHDGTEQHHLDLARLDRVQKRALSLIGPGAVVDSLALRRTISGLCVLFKLMCGARLPCMAELLPPPADYANPRTRRQLQAAHGHCFQLKQTLPSRSHNTILQSFPNAHIPIWNSLPSSVLQEAPCLRSLQSFKSKSYKHLLKKDWLWATQAYP